MMSLILVVALLAWVGSSFKEWFDVKAGVLKISILSKKLVVALVILVVLEFIFSAFVIIPAGSRGVIFDKFSGVKPTALKEGFNVVIPIIQNVIVMEVRTQKADIKAEAASKDMQTVATNVALNYYPVPETVPELYKQVGLNYVDKIIAPSVQEVVKACTAKYTAEELITKRENVKNDIQAGLTAKLAKSDIKLTETYITNFDFSKDFSEAIEMKQVAEQSALKAQRDLQRIKIEADQKIASARAEAESLKMQRDAITPALLELRKIEMQKTAIEKWDGKMPEIMLGNGSMPFIDISKYGNKGGN